MTTTLRLELAAALLIVLSLAARTQAQEARWIPVLVDQGSADQKIALVNAVATALHTQENIELVDPAIAARKFEAAHSGTPVEVPEEELRALGDSFSKALEAAALGQWDRAYELVRSFDELAQPVQDYASWRLSLGRDIAHYCLMSVHFMLDAGREAAARDEMRNCIYAAPDSSPSVKDTPPRVIELHASVKSELLRLGEASLDVDLNGVPTAGADGCVVVVNGLPKGSPPYRETGLLAVPVRIQVNCQRPGRIHTVRLKPGRNSLIVDLRFERVVHSDGSLRLQYRDSREEEASQLRDGLSLAKAVGGTDLLLVGEAGRGRIGMQRFAVDQERLLAEVTLATKASSDEIRAAAHALATHRSGDIMAQPETAAPTVIVRTERPSLYAGVALTVGTVGAYGLAWGAYVKAMRYRSEVSDLKGCMLDGGIGGLCEQNFASYEALVDASLVVGTFAAALGIATAPAVLPEHDGVPLWSWFAAAAGVGAVTVGAVLWSQSQECAFGACEDSDPDASLGQLLMLHGPPLLAIPITYGVRALLHSDDVAARAAVEPDGARLFLTGVL